MKDREVKYHVNHLDLFNTDEDIEKMKILTDFNDDAITILIDDVPIISTGIRVLNECTGEIWMVKSNYLENHSIFIVKRLKELINIHASKYNLKRIQTVIEPRHQKWIENLGFEMESELVNFTNEGTIYLYRRLF
jgi:hypothetical protein